MVKNFAKRQKDLGELNGFIEEAITGADVTTLYGKEKRNCTKISIKLMNS